MQVHWRKAYGKIFNASQFPIFHLLMKCLTEYLLSNISYESERLGIFLIGTGLLGSGGKVNVSPA